MGNKTEDKSKQGYKSTTHEERFMHIHFTTDVDAAHKVLEIRDVVSTLDERTLNADPTLATAPDLFIAAANLLVAMAPRFIGATVFARKEDDGIWYGAVSLCSSADQFNRKSGRASARRRYFAHSKQELTRSEKIDFQGLREAILHMRAKEGEYELERLLQRTPDIFKTLLPFSDEAAELD